MKPKIPILALLALAAAVFAIVSVARTQPRREPTQPPSPPPASEYREAVAAVGVVEPSSENIRIGTHLSGVVDEVLVRAGENVTSGAPLFRLDTRQLRAALAEAEAAASTARAAVRVAEASLADFRQQLELARNVRDKRAISADELERRAHAASTAEARLIAARAAVDVAESHRRSVAVEIERSTVRASIDGRVLQVKVRPGEFASAGPSAEPLMVLGRVAPLYVRVDVDEHEAWRVRPERRATGALRGNASVRSPLRFVRVEPLVVPKRSLTGDAAERVDTRVLQVLYEIERRDAPFFVGQQMDVFIDAGGRS
jgi:multidrug efflux pump subunit AcrA (membrane-fusion protein)